MTIVVPADGDDLDPLWGVDITNAVNDLLAAVTAPWVPWTVTWANLTVGNGQVISEYKKIGQLVVARLKFQLGTTSVVGTSPAFSLPATASSGYAVDDWLANGDALDAGILAYSISLRWNSTTQGRFNIAATSPFTFGNGDSFASSFFYKSA